MEKHSLDLRNLLIYGAEVYTPDAPGARTDPYWAGFNRPRRIEIRPTEAWAFIQPRRQLFLL